MALSIVIMKKSAVTETLHARIQEVLSGGGGSNFDVFFFLVDEGWEDPSTTLSGQSSAR